MRRVFAWIGIIAILAAFLSLVYCSATGAPANVILAILLAMILVPILIYGFIVASKAFTKQPEQEDDGSNSR